MSVIIRLQNLPWSANALDIRQFFHGLSIPEGGVHIVGGEQGDAFIAFSTDEDARQAFSRNNGKIKEIQISLMLSSRTEMQKVIEAARAQSYAAFMPTAAAPMPAAVPSIPSAVPEVKKDKEKDRRDRKRSRSRSRDRNRRRHRDRSRSRSRERRERRRRDRSKSRGRSRSRERERKARKRSPDFQKTEPKKLPEVWAAPAEPVAPQPPSMFGGFPGALEDARRNLTALSAQVHMVQNNLPQLNNLASNRVSWPQNTDNDRGGFMNRSEEIINDPRARNNFPRHFQRNTFQEQYEEQAGDTSVRLQPFYGSYSDIRRFFQGCFISNVGIKFINDDFGHRTGIVYIQFRNQQSKIDAMHKHGEILNGVKVEVAHISDAEFEEAVDRYQPNSFPVNNDHKFRSKNITKYFNKQSEPEIQNYSCLIVDDLPTYVKEQDILKLFSPRPLLSLFLTSKPRGGHIAYVKFGSADEAKKAYEEKATHVVEGKQVTVKPCEDQEFESISQKHNVDLETKQPSPGPDIETDCLNLTQLPLQTNNVQIADFFSDIGVRPTKIHLISNRSGFTGQAFCEFDNLDEAGQALKKDGTNFGASIVSIQPIPREEMEGIVNKMPQPLLQPRMPLMAPTRPYYPRNNFDGAPRGGPRFMGHRAPRPRFMNAVPTDDAPPGCTVYMDNVPYKAGTNEILEFFDGYDITNNVSRRFNPNNTPSAEAKVVFTSADEAYRAVQEKNGHKIWERPIYLKQV